MSMRKDLYCVRQNSGYQSGFHIEVGNLVKDGMFVKFRKLTTRHATIVIWIPDNQRPFLDESMMNGNPFPSFLLESLLNF